MYSNLNFFKSKIIKYNVLLSKYVVFKKINKKRERKKRTVYIDKYELKL
jgi:hypothetical protein